MTNPSLLVELDLSGANRLACRCGTTLMFFAPERQYITCASCGSVVLTIKECSLTNYTTRMQNIIKNLYKKHSSSVSLTEEDSR